MKILKKAEMLEQEAADFGFAWENTQQIMTQIKSECMEIMEHLDSPTFERKALQEEIGDLFHAVLSLCVFLKFDTDETVGKAVDKFERRFKSVKELAGLDGYSNLRGFSFPQLMQYWKIAKKTVV
jgi:uncharacterized protein YabN with tetrapyrrole methylase and pyrophosphatase domain